nr:dynein regulatory complex protein 1 homolog [Aegilops tauschii subsp. strangulata]
MAALSQLGEELVDVDARLATEVLRLADERHQLKVAINLGRLQHERARAKAGASLVTSREASARALEEAREPDRCRQAAEERERELRAFNATLEQQVEACRAVLASMRGAPSKEKEIHKHEEALMEASERSLELERLEARERHVVMAEDAITVRQAKIQEEADRRVAKAREDLANEYDLKLKFLEAEAEGRTTALRSRLDEAEQCERTDVAAQTSAQADLASTRADLLSLQQQIDDVASLAQQNREEACRWQTL